jgi:homoserine trans-succinylase
MLNSISNPIQDKSNKYLINHQHAFYEELKKYYDINEYKIISTVRNPWDRVVSLYHHYFKHRKKQSKSVNGFPDFVNKMLDDSLPGFDPDFKRPSYHWAKDADLVLKFEGYDSNVMMAFECMGFDVSVRHENISKNRGDYRKYFNDELASMIGEYYIEDVDNYGYSYRNV